MAQIRMSAEPSSRNEPVRRVRLGRLEGCGPHVVRAEGRDLVVVRTAAGVRAFEGHCPHRGALLGEGELDGNALVCRNHYWRFDAESGRRLDGPGCLASYPAHEVDGEVVVELPLADAARGTSGSRRTIESLPGPKGLPFVGNALQLDIPRLHENLEAWVKEFGPVYRYRLGSKVQIAIADPDLIDEALRRRPDGFRRMSAVESVFEEMKVGGVFSAEGAAWRPQRRLSMEALSHRHLRDFYATLARVAENLRARIARCVDDGGAIDIVDTLKRFTVDVTTLLTLGHDVNTLGKDEDVIQRKLEHIFPAFNRRLFALFPLWRIVRLPVDRRLDEALEELRAFMRQLVDDARARFAADATLAERPANFLEAMVIARDEEGRPFSDDLILGNLVTMLVAGEDTTAYTLAWAIHHLCDDDDAVARLVSEADDVLEGGTVPPSFEAANRLAYAGAVANETMRLRPVAPLLFLEAIGDTTLGDIELPAGTGVSALVRPPVLDASNFAEPRTFKPERWLPGAPGPHEPSVHMPFGSGPRLCPGRALALLEMKLVLATLYRSFRIERSGAASSVRERFTFTMNPEGLDVTVARR